MSYYPGFAALVNDALLRLDRSPAWLAQRLDVNPSTVSRWLNQGARPRSPEMVVRVADVLGLTSARQALLAAAGFGYQEAPAEPYATRIVGGGPGAAVPAPPPAVAPVTPDALSRLATSASPFMGREEELDQIATLLAGPDCRLLTVTGMGGVGKTRLAAQAAASFGARFAAGAVVVPLHAVDDAGDLALAILQTLGIPPPKRGSAETALLDHLRDRELLLVLDNYEHLLPHVELVERLLGAASGLTILVTSRARLGLRQERVFVLAGLPAPPERALTDGRPLTPTALDRYAAAALFLHCARRVAPSFYPDGDAAVALARVCRLLDGLPLALELAAGWVRALSLPVIAQQIEQGLGILAATADSVAARHRSLRAVFDHSWRLLTADEQRVLRRLAVFPESFDYAAAVAVAGADPPLLLALVDRSWLVFSAADRYRFHPLLHQYLTEKLAEDAAQRDETRTRHMQHYAALARTWDIDYWTAQQKAVTRTMGPEFPNIRAAWREAERRFDLEAMHALCRAFNPLGFQLGESQNLMRWCRDAAARIHAWLPGHADQLPAAARLVINLRCNESARLVHLGQYQQALPLIEETLAWRRGVVSSLPDPNEEMSALYWQLGMIAEAAGRYAEAEQHYLASIEYSRTQDSSCERIREASSVRCLADLYYQRGRLDESEQYAREAIELFTRIGDARFRSDAQRALARIAFVRGDYMQADKLFRDILEIRRELNDRQGISKNIYLCGDTAAALGRYDEALRLYAESLQLAEAIGMRAVLASTYLGQAQVARARSQVGEAEACLDHAQRTAPDSWDPHIIGHVCCCRGEIALDRQDLAAACTAFQACLDHMPALDPGSQIRAHTGLARAALGRQRAAEARTHCLAALQLAAALDLAPAKLETLDIVADLAAARGDHHQAAQLLALVQQHPAAHHELRRRAAARLAAWPASVAAGGVQTPDLGVAFNTWLARLTVG